jgi:hypothetical protein
MNFYRLILFILALLYFSCKKNVQDVNETDPLVEEDCRYQFELNIADIYGAWEPKQIINLEDGDTSNYEIGEGHTGFMLTDHYADSFEFRPDSSVALYYVESGRFCESRVDGTWYTNNDTIFISRDLGGIKKIPIIALSGTELVVEDTINFVFSKSIFRKSN